LIGGPDSAKPLDVIHRCNLLSANCRFRKLRPFDSQWQANQNMIAACLPSIAPSDGRPQPVRVRLQRISCDLAKAHPPDGQGNLWWARLKKALGTSSSAFVNASLFQLQGAARLPGGGISEIAVNAALAVIEAVAPKDEVEAALAVQMAAKDFRGQAGSVGTE
jgi:hypothetical protein